MLYDFVLGTEEQSYNPVDNTLHGGSGRRGGSDSDYVAWRAQVLRHIALFKEELWLANQNCLDFLRQVKLKVRCFNLP